MNNTDPIWQLVDERLPTFAALSDAVWDTPELCYAETRSATAIRDELARQGFTVTSGLAGIPTAFMGESGADGPLIAFLGEFDALAGLSQVAGSTERREVVADGNGHGCGHNLLGSAALLAAVALKTYLADNGLPGRVRFYGCPAEEGGGAKVFMVREGCFDGVDVAISWHPFPFTEVNRNPALANTRLDFHFSGRAAHAAVAPELGRSALDAAELMNVGVNFLREHAPSDARMHYAFLDAGGTAPNVVQASASLSYSVRALEAGAMRELVERVKRIAQGAAVMTDTTVRHDFVMGMSNLLPNTPLERTMQAAADSLGGVPFDDTDRVFAAAMQKTFPDGAIAAAYRRVGKSLRDDEPLSTEVLALDHDRAPMFGSTDVGDVSWVVPTVQMNVASYAIGTPGHSWQLVAQGKSPASHKAIAHAAKIMAATGRRVAQDPELLREARADHARRLAVTPYVCPIPADVAPIFPTT